MKKWSFNSKGELVMSTEISNRLDIPDFMRDAELGTHDLANFVTPPRAKVVQAQSGPPLSDMFHPGDVIAVPIMQMIAPMNADDGTLFVIVPVFFYPEWCQWNPLELKGTAPAIVARSLDPRSDLARKCKDSTKFREPHPEMPGLFVRNVEHLNFVCSLMSNDSMFGMPLILSFSRGEHRSGSNFAALIRLRKAPMYGCQFVAQVPKKKRANQKGQWFGIDIMNPPEGIDSYVRDEELFKSLQAEYERMRDAHARGVLVVDHDEDSTVDVAESTAF